MYNTTRILLIVLLLLTTGIEAKKANSFEFYSDGIYDAYIQINREVQAGLSTRYMEEYNNKYLVVLDVENSSTVDIIYYKTIGSKNSLSADSVVYISTGRSYLVFDHFDRKANAKLLLKKLSSYGLNVKIFDKRGGRSYKRNPIVITKLINDLKDTVKNTPVKVLTVENVAPIPLPSFVPPLKKSRSSKKTSATVDAFLRLREKFCKAGGLSNGVLFVEGEKYKKGNTISEFLYHSTKKEGKSTVAVLKGKDGKFYKLRPQSCKNKKVCEKGLCDADVESGPVTTVSSDPMPEEDPTHVDASNSPDATPGDSSESKNYICDFGKIYTAKDKDGEAVVVSETPYGSMGKSKSTVAPSGKGIYRVRSKGALPIYISERYLVKACKSTK